MPQRQTAPGTTPVAMHLVQAALETLFLQPANKRTEPAMKTSPSIATRSRPHGFTLIEIMIVVAIVAILSAIALPSYSEYVKRGQIVDGLVPLADTGAKMEQYFQDKRTYEGACSTVKPATTARFEYACSADGTSFTMRASGKGSMADFVFQLDQGGNRTTTTVPTGWTAGTNCWSTNKGGSC